MRHIVTTFLFVAFTVALVASPTFAGKVPGRTLTYDVYLDGRRIGYHRFEIVGTKSSAEVLSEANFDVGFLFFTAYEYEHRARESWQEGCLKRIRTRTNANGKRLRLSGTRTDAGFVLETGEEEAALPGFVMTFAYWNPGFLDQQKLLNPQTGEYLEVEVEELGQDMVEVDGRRVAARSVRVTARAMDITLWYASSDSEWLALESVAKGGRVIRYELS